MNRLVLALAGSFITLAPASAGAIDFGNAQAATLVTVTDAGCRDTSRPCGRLTGGDIDRYYGRDDIIPARVVAPQPAPVAAKARRFGLLPEPATWAMVIFGMGAIGGLIRRRVRLSEARFTRMVRQIPND